MSVMSLFDPPVDPANCCPYCLMSVTNVSVDTGTQMRAVEDPNGPYVMHDGLLRFLTTTGDVLCRGVPKSVLRRATRDEPRYSSHFYNCPKSKEWCKR